MAECLAVRDFRQPGHYLMMATRRGLVKKTELDKYSRPMKGGIIAIKLKEDDELVDVVIAKTGDEIVLETERGMAIRFSESDARPMGRNTSGVKGIRLGRDDALVGMVVADPDATLLTVCANGYGKRTFFGPNNPLAAAAESESAGEERPADRRHRRRHRHGRCARPTRRRPTKAATTESTSSSNRYRTQRRGGKGLRDIKTTDRNGPVIAVVGVSNDDEVLMMTARGKIQRTAVAEISVIGRNTQGVRIMSLDAGDALAAVVRVPRDATAPLSESEPAAAEEPGVSPPDEKEPLPPPE